MSDYYSLLEIDKNASEDDIKKAYKRLSLKWHPDRNPGKEKEAEEMFKKINHAKNILIDPDKRRIYDSGGEERLNNNDINFNPLENIFSMFTNNFGNNFGNNFFNFGNTPRNEKKEIIVNLTLEQVYSGYTYNKKLKIEKKCEKCKGTGKKVVNTCKKCRGSGMFTEIRQIGPGMISQQTCPCNLCNNRGYVGEGEDKCECKDGLEVKIISINVSFRPGVNENEFYQYSTDGIDFYFIAKIQSHHTFERNGNDLIFKKSINLLEALSGVEFVLRLLDEREIKIKSKEGLVIIQNHEYILKNLGINGGKLKIKFDILFPEKINRDGKNLEEILGFTTKEMVKEDLEEYYLE